MSLLGKVAIVSGAAQGLGRAFAIRLAEEGCDVLGFDVKKEVLDVPGLRQWWPTFPNVKTSKASYRRPP